MGTSLLQLRYPPNGQCTDQWRRKIKEGQRDILDQSGHYWLAFSGKILQYPAGREKREGLGIVPRKRGKLSKAMYILI